MKNLATTEIFKPSLLSSLVNRACGVLSTNDRTGKRRWSAPAAGKLPAMRLETMEPRVLLSADLLVTAAAGANDLTVKYDATTAEVQVINNVNNAVVAHDLASNVLSVKIQGSTGTDRIVIDLTSGLSNSVIATDTTSGDSDLIQVKGPDATWTLDGANAGYVGSALSFSGFEKLLGDAVNQDTFVLGAAGSISGSIDGGTGAGDALVIEARTVATSSYAANGPHAGLLTINVAETRFAGIELITDNLVVTDRVITATAGDDHIRIKSGGAGKITVESDNNSFAGITFTAPASSLTLKAGGGDDTLTIGDDVLAALPGDIQFWGEAGTDTLVVASQRDVTLTDTAVFLKTSGTGPTINLTSIDQAFVAGLTVSATGFTKPLFQAASGSTLQIDDGMAILARMLRSTDGTFSLASLLDETLTLAQLQTQLDALDGTVGNVTLDTTTVPGETRLVVHVVRNLSALFDLKLDGSANFGGALGTLLQALDLDGLVALDFEANLNITIGTDGDGFFIVPNASSTPELTVTKMTHDAGDVSATGRMGFLGVDLKEATMAFDADAGLAFKFNDAVVNDGKIRLTELPELASEPPEVLTASALTDASATDLTVTGVLSVAPGLDTALPIADTNVTFTWADLTSTPDVALTGDGALDIANFLKLDPTELLSSLGKLQTSLDELIGKLDVDLPFVADGLNGLDGLVDVFAFLNDSDLAAVQTVQQLVTALGLDPSDLVYDALSGQITFDLSFDKAFSGSPVFALDFDLANGLADFSTSSTAAIAGTLSVNLTLGLDGKGALGGASALDWLFLQDVNLNYTATATTVDLDATARFGFVKIEVFDGTASANFAVDLNLLDSGSYLSDGRLDLSEFQDALTAVDGLTDLVDIDVAGSVALTLPVKVAFLGINSSTATADNTLTMYVDMDNPDDATVILPTALSDLGNFARLDAATLVGLLGQVTGYLDQLRKSDTFAAADVPLIGPVLDDILGLADAFRDGVLFDDADDGKDGSTTLLFDINAALEAPTLAGKLRAEISDGKFRLVANDASITSISVAAVTALGIAGTETTTGGVFKSLTGSVAIPNVVSGDVTLAIALNGAAAVNVLVTNTGNNTKLGNDRRKLVDGVNAATFTTVEELVLKFTELLGANGLLTYNALDDTLTIDLKLADTFGQVDVPVDFDLPGLPEFLELQTQGKLRLTASGDLNLTAGIYLGAAPSGDKITLSKPLSEINGGIATDVPLTATAVTSLPGFKLSADAGFKVVLDGTSYDVSVTKLSTDNNSFLLDVVSDVQAAIDAVEGLKNQITVGLTGTKLNFVAVNTATKPPTYPATSLVITAVAGSTAVTELGLGTTNTANRDNFTITLSDSTSYSVSLFGATTLDDVKTAIESATGNNVQVSLNDRETGLNLTDATTGASAFKVLLANKSTAAIGLGILAADAGEGETADGVIEGSDLGGLSALERFFLKDVSANVTLSLSTPQLVNGAGAPTDTDSDGTSNDGITGTAKFGFVGIDVAGGGTLVANLGIALLDPGTTAADGRISVVELLTGLNNPSSLLDLSLTGSGSLALDVSMSPDLPGLTLPANAQIKINIDSFGNPFAALPELSELPVISFTFPDFGALLNFGNVDLNFASIIDGLQSLTDFLGDFEAFGFLSEPLPLIDLSVNDLISVADRFAQAVEDAQANSAATIQLLEDKLKEAFGIPQLSDLIDLVLYTDTLGTTDPEDDLNILRINLTLAAGFNESVALNLDLAELLGMEGVLSLAGAANLNASGDITVQLDFGFDIENPLDVYIFESTGIDADILAEGNDVSFRAALGPVGVFVKDGSAHIDANATLDFDAALFVTPTGGLPGDGDGRVKLVTLLEDFADNVNVEFGGTASAILPVYFPTESIHAGDITLAWSDLFDPSTLSIDVPDDLLTIDLSQFSLFDQLLLGVDGIDLFLEGLQDILDGEVGGVTLPLVGDKLAGAADVIGDFRSGFVDDFRQAIEDLANPGDAASGADPLSTILFNLLGSDAGGLNLLLDITDDGLITVDDVQYDTNLDEPGVAFADSFIKWNFKLGGNLLNVGAGIGFDIGIPGLGLETEGDIKLDISWELALGFGITGTDGFYLDISDDSELELNVDVTVPGASITGTLGFLQLTATDDTTDDDGLFTHLGATFGVNIKNGKDANDENLSFGELGKITLEVGIAAEAVVDLDMKLSLSSDLVPNADTNFPSVVADFTLVWSLGDRGAGELVSLSELDGGFLKNGLKYVGFDHVGLDLGSYFSDVIGPIVEKVQEITDPIKPFLDFLTAEIPVISQLAGPTTMLDIAAMSGMINPGIIKAIEIVDQVIDLVDSIDVSGGPIVLYFDDLIPSLDLVGSREELLGAIEGGELDFAALESLPFDLDATALKDLKSGLLGGKTPAQIAAGLASGLSTAGGTNPGDKSPTAGVNKMLKGGALRDGFKIDILDDPSQIFGMLMGQPADLVSFTMAPLTLKANYSAFFSLLGPLGVSINADLAAQFGPFRFAYDTFGAAEFADGGFHNPALLLDGLYIDDTDGNGNDVPELQFDIGLWAAAELNLGVARGGVGGGLFAAIDFDLHDPNNDGRVRIKEIITNVLNEYTYGEAALSPLAIFDITGKLTAELFAFVKVDLLLFKLNESWDITDPITLLDFESNFTRVPTLATELGDGVLQLNMGKFADQRIEGDLSDGDDHFIVTQKNTSEVWVWSTLVDFDGDGEYDEDEAQSYEATSLILALGGEGDDIIDLSGVTANLAYELEGNSGDDVIKAGSGTGAARILGGAGNDELHGGAGDDTIFGEAGDDVLYGGAGDDWLLGDGRAKDTIVGEVINVGVKASDGADKLYGEAGNDLLLGFGGADEAEGGDGDDLLIGDAGTITVSGRAAIKIENTDAGARGFNDLLSGGANDDQIYGGKGDDTINGDAGADELLGEQGFDIITGDAGADLILGGDDNDTIDGGSGNDQIYGNAGADLINGGDADDWIYGGTGADIIHGNDGSDHLFGNSDPDKLYGDAGNDYLEGGQGNDLLLGDVGQDTLVAGYGSDTLDGQDDSDKYLITARGGLLTELTTAYDSGASGTDTLTFSGTSYSDTVLLRAMADAYFPLQSKLDGLVSKYFNSGEADKLGAILQAVQDAYGPHDVPTGMVGAITTAYEATGASVTSIVAAVADHYKSELETLGADTDTVFIALINSGGAKVERFNYRNLEGITVNTLAGEDYVVSDDVLAATTINLGLDDDTVQVGQVFRSERSKDFDGLITGITAEDIYSTTEITRGWLSNGVSVATTINGGDGNDNFTVFRNVAVLNLNGGDGDDLFTVRAFALAGSTDSERARTDMKGDGGADTILYAVNAPVGIDGGDGFDTVRVVGTEFADDFVITDSGVFGAGLNISYVNIEKLVADGAEGDDRYFVLSTGLDVVTEIDGGLGSDSFFVGGNPSRSPIAVISDDLRGHSGIILHSVESNIDGSAWQGLPVDGLSANVGDNEESMVLVSETAGSSSVFEGMAYASNAAGLAFDSYTIRLTRQPTATVRVNVVPAGMSPEEEAKGYADLVFLKPGTDAADDANWVAFADLPALEFTIANWNTAQSVTFRAVNDAASEGKRFTFINHTLRNSDDPEYRDVQMRSVKVLMNDDDRDGVVITPSGTGNTVLEDGFTDSFEVRLTKAPTSTVTVDMSVLNNDISLSSLTLTFTTGNWNTAQTVTVTGKSDTYIEGFHTDYISFNVVSSDAAQTLTVSSLAIDGDFDLPGIQSIPVDKATTYVLLPNRPVVGTLSVSVGGVALAADRFDLRGNTLSFLSTTGMPEQRTGQVLVSYSYIEAGYNGTEVRDAVVDIYDEDTPMVIIEPVNDGSLDVIEGSGTTDSYIVRLSRAPGEGETVTVTADAFKTRTTYGGTALFNEQVTVNGESFTTLIFTNSNLDWKYGKTVTVAAIDDTQLDGNDTQVLAPELQTVNKIRGPLIIEGAAGEGSLTLPAPLMMPWEVNQRPSDGDVMSFSSGSGAGASETMEVLEADLDAVVAALTLEDATITTIQDLIGKTLEMTVGAGTAVVIDANRPRDLFDRFWLITSVTKTTDGKVTLGLKNPSQIDPGKLPDGSAPTSSSEYAITSLSMNFFADEREQVDYLFVYDQDSVANDVGALTSSDGAVIGFTNNQMTVELAALQRAAKLLGLSSVDELAGKTIEITVGDGVGRSWTIAGVASGPSAEYRTLTLTDASGSGTPNNRSEFRIEGSDRYGRIVGFGMGPNVLFNGRSQPGGITYGDLEVVDMGLGSGNDQVRVDYAPHSDDHATERSGDFHTLLMLDTGAGNDRVTVKLDAVQDGQFALSLGQGDDTVIGGDSSADLIVFGNDGADAITTGSGADTVFGDSGRVDYVNGTGAIVTRFGHTEARNLINPPVDSASNAGGVATLTDTDANFATSYGGLAGLMMQVIGADGHVQYRRIVSNTATTLTLDTPWDTLPTTSSAYRVSVYPEDQTDGLYRGARHVWSIDELPGGNDTLSTGAGDDTAIGGAGNDAINGDSGSNWLAGDDAKFDYLPVAGTDGATRLSSILDPNIVGDDTLTGGGDNDFLLGGFGNDILYGMGGDDVLIGDAAVVNFDASGMMVRIETLDGEDLRNGADELRGEDGSDVLIGGGNSDRIDGGSEDDLIFGDNVLLTLNPGSGDAMSTRYRTVAGALYDADGNELLGTTAQTRPGGNAAWADWTITLDASMEAGRFGDDYLAGGAHSDTIFGQRGNDTIQGDGSIDEVVSALRVTDGSLQIDPSVESVTDGDDYIEGNAGADLIFGNLGQDDIVGGSSSAFVFSLKAKEQRDDGTDMIFGGAGTDLARNDLGDQSHGRDADMILGDNGNIFRIVTVTVTNNVTALRTFNYDNYASDTRIVVRAAGLVDYTPGGKDYVPTSADQGAADEIHGESGDDFIYGMAGDDVLFGEGQDDDLIGGWGHDWMSGGTGDDGVLGDDGRLLTSRNGTAEPLAGVVTATVQSTVSTPGGVQTAILNPTGQLSKVGDLTPFNVDPVSANVLAVPKFVNDIIYGGWGNDFLHGGSGDDAMSGAEALPIFYTAPKNSGNVLQYNVATGQFTKYDEYAPMTQINDFLLNFNATEGPQDTYAAITSHKATDGEDKLFGDLGNDWLVGGSGRDALYGGWGDDLLNADDDQSTAGGLNNTPDTHTSYEDRAFGGAGRDVLIANTGGDRLIDWVGEFNSYIVPFAPFGNATVSRTLQPQLAEFLYAVSKSDGADPNLGNTSDPRNGEPLGELGVIRQSDSVWQEQTGAPADPQAGNVPGGKRDVLRSADMNNGQTQGLLADSGVWQVTGGALEVAASSPQADAVAVYQVGDALPSYFEVTASIKALKPTAGWNANSYVVFDYQSKTNFKFAGIDASTNKLVMGQRTAAGWEVLQQVAFSGSIKSGTWYNVMLSVNGLTATLIVDNKTTLNHTFKATVVDGYSYGLNWGLVGFGSNKSRGAIDNIAVQVVPPTAKVTRTEDFSTGMGPTLTAVPNSSIGAWSVNSGLLAGSPPAGADAAFQLLNVSGVSKFKTDSLLEMSTVLRTSGRTGFVFDSYSDTDFKWVAVDTATKQVLIGHRSGAAWVVDAVASNASLSSTANITLGVTVKGSSVSVTVNGQTVLGFAFNAVAVDGRFGLFTNSATARFDSVTVKTNDSAVPAALSSGVAGTNLSGAEADIPASTAQIQALIDEATRLWGRTEDPLHLAALGSVQVSFADLPAGQVAEFMDGQLVLDRTADGFGWFVDATPGDNSEFSLVGGVLTANALSGAYGRMDMLSAIAHELGHAMGLGHGSGVMSETLLPGQRVLPEPDAPAVVLQKAITIDWARADSEEWLAASNDLTLNQAWRQRFVNHLGASESSLRPNASMRFQIGERSVARQT